MTTSVIAPVVEVHVRTVDEAGQEHVEVEKLDLARWMIPPELVARLEEANVMVIDRDAPYGRLLLRLDRAIAAQAQTFNPVDEIALAMVAKQLREVLCAVLEQAVDRLAKDAAAQLAQPKGHTGLFVGGPANPDPTFIAEESHDHV